MNFEEKTIRREEIFAGKVINVHRDIIELPNGKEGFREVADHPGGVMVAPLKDNGNLVFVRQFRYPFHKVILELPAGKLEKGENPREAGIRELQEEVGATATSVVPIGQIYPTPAYSSEIIYLFCATGLTFGEQSPDEDEFLEMLEIPLEKAFEMVINNEISDAKTVAGVLKIHKMRQDGLL